MVYVALACAALSHSTRAWCSFFLKATFLALFVSGLIAWNIEGRTKAFWFGFTFLGLSYLALARISHYPYGKRLSFVG